MTTTEVPYFMENEDWYYHDEKEWKYKLTDKLRQKQLRATTNFTKK